MKDTKNQFKVNMNSEDVLIAGGTRRVFLNYHNRLKRMLQHIDEVRDIELTHIRLIEDLIHELHSTLQFAPQKDKMDDSPMFYADYVLSSDDKAWQSAYKMAEIIKNNA